MRFLEQSINSYVIDFIKKWKDKVLPVINKHLQSGSPWIDLTEEFRSKKGCKITREGISSGQKVYGLIFKGCRGMGEKWELTDNGNIKKDIYGNPLVKVYSTSVALVPLDLIVEFISTDEILPVDKKFASPYGLGQAWIEKLMEKIGCSPKEDLVFFFVSFSDDISFKIRRFLKEFLFVVDGGYLRKKGFLRIDGPQWREYFPSNTLSNSSKLFLNSAVENTFTQRRMIKTRDNKT